MNVSICSVNSYTYNAINGNVHKFSRLHKRNDSINMPENRFHQIVSRCWRRPVNCCLIKKYWSVSHSRILSEKAWYRRHWCIILFMSRYSTSNSSLVRQGFELGTHSLGLSYVICEDKDIRIKKSFINSILFSMELHIGLLFSDISASAT